MAILVALFAVLVAPASVSAAVSVGPSTEGSTAARTSSLTIASPNVTQARVNDGAVLIAHLVAVGGNQSAIYLCPAEDGWVELSRTVDLDGTIVQQLWYRVMTAPQDSTTTYTFGVNRDGCGSASTGTPNRSLTGVISVYSGVETTDPILANRSRATGTGDAAQGPTTQFQAPQVAAEQPAGAFVLRFLGMNEYSGGINGVEADNAIDSPRLYQARSDAADERTIAGFGSALPSASAVEPFRATATAAVTWVAATVVLREADEVAPATTATFETASGPFTPGPDTWSDEPVNVYLSGTDNPDGTGVKAIYYSTNGVDWEDATNLTYIQVTTSVDFSYYAVDNAGNAEQPTTVRINVDQDRPSVSASAVRSSGATYTSGEPTSDNVTVTLTATDLGGSNVREVRYTVNGGSETVVPGASATIPVTTPGTTTITYWAVDNAGLESTPRQTFTVNIDRTAPVISGMPGNLTVEATSTAGAVVTWPAPAATDNTDGTVPVVCAPPSGSIFPIGMTTVECTATDAAGNVANSGFTVTVNDTNAPGLNLPGPITVNATGPNGAVVTYTATASDNLGVVTLVCTPPSGSLFSVGTTTVNCTATDSVGNPTTGSFTVTVAGAADLLAQLRADTITYVTNAATERAMVATLDQIRQSLDRGNSLGAYFSMLQYIVQLDRAVDARAVSPANAMKLIAQAKLVMDAIM